MQNGIYGLILFIKFVILKFLQYIYFFQFPQNFCWIKFVCNNRNRNRGCQFQHNRITTATADLKNTTTEAGTEPRFSENSQPIHHYIWYTNYQSITMTVLLLSFVKPTTPTYTSWRKAAVMSLSTRKKLWESQCAPPLPPSLVLGVLCPPRYEMLWKPISSKNYA